MAIALLRLVQYFSDPCLGIISVLANAADDIPIIHVALLNGISKKYYAQSLSVMKQGRLRCRDAIILITGRAAYFHPRMIDMFADYVSMNLRRTARRFASPAIPTAEMPINAARSTGIIGNFLLGGRFYGEKDMPKMRLYGASALLDRRRTLEVSVRTMRNDFYFVKGESRSC